MHKGNENRFIGMLSSKVFHFSFLRTAGVFFIILSLSSCKKESVPSRLSADVLSVMTDIYYWAAHARRQNVSSNGYSNAQINELLEALKSPEDRFTFYLTFQEAAQLRGTNMDLGISIRYLDDTLWIAFVEPGSPAHAAGIKRGQWVRQMNLGGRVFRTTPPQDIERMHPALRPTTLGTYALGLGSSSATLMLGKTRGPDPRIESVTLSPASYETKPVVVERVIQIEGQVAGYLYFSSFSVDRDLADSQISQSFQRFKEAGVRHLIIDMRYNRGGYVSVARKLINFIYTPPSPERTLMYKLEHNSAHAANNTQEFFKTNPVALNPERIYFLVDRATASASELVINTLLPFYGPEDIQLIGRATTGKNVGSYAIDLPLNSAQPRASDPTHVLLPISFIIFNKDGQADYANGFSPDNAALDGLRYELGHHKEAMLASAIHHIRNGYYPTTSARLAFRPSQPLFDLRDRIRERPLMLLTK